MPKFTVIQIPTTEMIIPAVINFFIMGYCRLINTSTYPVPDSNSVMAFPITAPLDFLLLVAFMACPEISEVVIRSPTFIIGYVIELYKHLDFLIDSHRNVTKPSLGYPKIFPSSNIFTCQTRRTYLGIRKASPKRRFPKHNLLFFYFLK